MADVDSSMRSVHTTSRTRILYGIGIAIVGGEPAGLSSVTAEVGRPDVKVSSTL
jgi:hypothetical protein